LSSPDDAGVYLLRDGLAIIQTLDFITPIVDDPFTFGQIAAANSLSDVYSMGGRPITAMNIACFPKKTMDLSVLREVTLGGLDRINEAGASLIGGHTVEDPEMKYGLSVTGVIDPARLLRKQGAKPGDCLVLTKPIGTGIISTAFKRGEGAEDAMAEAIKSMVVLNAAAARLVQEIGANACTDITGFGLLGHAAEMMDLSKVGLRIEWSAVPRLPQVEAFAEAGVVTAGAGRNRGFRAHQLNTAAGIPDWAIDVLFDPQTSGGLLISLPEPRAEKLVSELRKSGISKAAIIGSVTSDAIGRISIS